MMIVMTMKCFFKTGLPCSTRFVIIIILIIIIIIIIIIITRPWPAFGRQGLGGSSGGDTSHG